MKDYIIARLHEASTWRGVIAIVTAAGIGISPEQANAIVAAGLAIMGALGAFSLILSLMLKAIGILLGLIEWWFVDWHQQNAQKERDALESNPADWFGDHFGGVSNNDAHPSSKTDQADPSNH